MHPLELGGGGRTSTSLGELMVAESSLEKKELGGSCLEISLPTQCLRLEEEYGRRSRGYLLTKKGITSNCFPHHTSFSLYSYLWKYQTQEA